MPDGEIIGVVVQGGPIGLTQPAIGSAHVVQTAEAAGPSNAPTITNLVPAMNAPLSLGGAVQFDITDVDTDAVLRVFIDAAFVGLDAEEVIHRPSTGFAARYAASTKTTIAGGFRFVLRRAGGWPAPPRVHVEAIDDRGTVSVLL